VPTYDASTLLPLCAGLTLLGLIGSWFAWRRRGIAAGTRGVAWSLLPVSLYMTGLLKVLWEVVRSVVSWAAHLIFSPTVWAGVALFGVSVVLYVVSGVARGRTPKEKAQKKKPASPAGELTTTGPAPASATTAKAAKPSKGKAKQQESSEFDEIEDILKRHGIN
jgi:asparagine N-glycosylation enzyme membrane subunit Stt3